MGPVDLEAVALEIRARAGLVGDEVRSSEWIARQVLGPRGVRRIPRFSTRAMLVAADDTYFILLRQQLRDENFWIAHELGHWGLRVLCGYQGAPAEEEMLASYVAGAIIAPPRVVRDAFALHGNRLPAYSRIFNVTQVCAWLRIAEVRQDSRAVVSAKGHAHVRGSFAWPERMAHWVEKRPPAGLTKVRITDDHRRVAIYAR